MAWVCHYITEIHTQGWFNRQKLTCTSDFLLTTMMNLLLSSAEVPTRDTLGQTWRTEDTPLSPMTPLTRRVPLIV